MIQPLSITYIADGSKHTLSTVYREDLRELAPKFRHRSNLYLPLTKIDRFAKNIGCGCDTVIFDLEDSIAPGAKELARNNLLRMPDRPANVKFALRVNDPSSPEFARDLDAFERVSERFHTIVLPKTESPREVQLIRSRFSQHSLAVRIETPLGVNQAFSIAETLHPGDTLGLGAGDMTQMFGIKRRPLYESPVLINASIQVASAAHQNGLGVIDMVSRHFADSAAGSVLEQEALWARDHLGATGKMVIHPAQVETVNRIFTPSLESISSDIQILNSFAEELGSRALRQQEGSYAGSPSFRTALDQLKNALAKGYISVE
jgi:citrate lyase subunit beta/citryl-CoA lyase